MRPWKLRTCYWCQRLFNPYRPNGGYVIDALGRIWCGDCPRPEYKEDR